MSAMMKEKSDDAIMTYDFDKRPMGSACHIIADETSEIELVSRLLTLAQDGDMVEDIELDFGLWHMPGVMLDKII
eukprot:scaffold47973_cov58-Attheya_sp.AAC.2